MFTFLTFVLCVVGYLVVSGVTHGYAKHRWPPKIERRQVYVDYKYEWRDQDDNSASRVLSTLFWPFYWTFIWPFTKANEVTFSRIEKLAAQQVAKNKVRIADLAATRAEVEKSNAELEQAEVELEKEIANS